MPTCDERSRRRSNERPVPAETLLTSDGVPDIETVPSGGLQLVSLSHLLARGYSCENRGIFGRRDGRPVGPRPASRRGPASPVPFDRFSQHRADSDPHQRRPALLGYVFDLVL